ncbi:hypothetical protein GTG28_06220 [Vibrio sp. OCN044]|uniref:Uncharacterized protein n=1 Tax=Vibrio tetraodonis subsp. pristinus TaxID=2695891 RepID=A0A6L8LTH2_9VIBR|nr:hypothetical protein [Vibrio tetraodonis]MYM58813.1 hypothetical protein [Vibrio tetraodonis subsp. pristinus]
MSRLLFLLLFFSLSSNASICHQLTKNTTYKLSAGISYCLESEYQFVYIHNSEFGTEIVELSDIDRNVFGLVYPGESAKVPDQFRVTTFDDTHLVVMDGYIHIYAAPKVRKKRSAANIATAVVSNLSSSAGTSLAGGSNVQVAPTIVGTVIGTGVGAATGPLAPVVGPLVAGALTQNIISNQGKPRPPLTIMSTTSGLNSGSNFVPRPFNSGGGSSKGCGKCHN